MAIADTDKLLVNNGSKTETITFAQFKDGTVLNDTDKFLINDGTKTETITWAEIEDELGPKGVVNTPTVLKPKDGAGSGEEFYLKTDTITKVEGGGINTCETELIESVQVEAALTTGVVRRVRNLADPNDIRAFGWDDLTDEENVTFGQKPSNNAAFSFQYCKVDVPQKLGFAASQEFTAPAEVALWRSDTGEADSWVLDTVGLTNTPNVGDYVVGSTPALYWGVIRSPIAGSPWATSSNMDGTTWIFYAQPNPETVLTFPSNQGFDCFEPGDVVQTDATGTNNPAWNETKIWSNGTIANAEYLSNPWERAFDGTTNNFAYNTATGESTLEFDPPISAGDFQFAHSNGSSNPLTNADIGIRLYNATGTEIARVPPISSSTPNAYDPTTYTANEPVAKIGLTGGGSSSGYANSYCIGAIKYEGLILVDAISETDVKVISKTDEAPWQILVDGGNWKGTDGSGNQVDGDDKLAKETPYDTKLTVDGSTDLADMTGGTIMTDGTGAPGPYSQTPYKLVTSEITNVDDSNPAEIELTFADPNPDLRYFKAGDVVQQTEGHEGLRINGVNLQSTIESFYPAIGRTEYNFTTLENIKWRTNTSGVEQPSVLGVEVKFNGKWIRLIDPRYKGQDSPETDPGFNHEQNWTDYVTGDDYSSGIYPPQYFFDGTVDDLTYRSVAAQDSDQVFEPPTPITGITGIAIYTYSYGTAVDDIYRYRVVSLPNLDDNTMIVDGGEWLGSDGSGTADAATVVEYQTNGGQGDVISVNTDDNTILLKDTGDRDNRWIAENKAATDFYVAGPSIIDEPLLTTNVELESSQFATTPDGVDGLKEIIWNINNVDQSAGTNNPYRPTGLPLNSKVTIRVKHVANSIGDSEWSFSTTFTTGASRSLKDHYVKQIRELEQQLSAAQGTKTRSVETGERKRARNADGTFKGDDPLTPDVNEAWEDGEPPAKGKGKGKKKKS